MDPALRELIVKGNPADEVEAIMRLHSSRDRLPAKARAICGFGNIRTIRLKRGDIFDVWSDSATASLKAARTISIDRPTNLPTDISRPKSRGKDFPRRHPKIRETGKGVVIGVIDWGFDFAHSAFRSPTGQTRIRAIWDQRSPTLPSFTKSPQPYGYGRVLTRRMIDKALQSEEPYSALQYHPGDADHASGAHGTHVADIAAGTTRANGGGVAPGAELVFVHLAADRLAGLSDLGNSVRIVEAVDFINRAANGRPVVLNLSLGRQGGSKCGHSLVERALDAFAESRDNAAIVQSAGNYFMSDCHASGSLRPGGMRTLTWKIARRDPTDNELEIWYSNRDRFSVTLTPPNGMAPVTVELGETKVIRSPMGLELGRIYHRADEPNTQSNHVDIFVYKKAPFGNWSLRLGGQEIVDGRYDAWIERDGAGRRGQSKFAKQDVDTSRTIGSIASGYNGIAVGAANTAGNKLKPARFASSGPTRDGRTKPDLVAPGVRIRAARSTPKTMPTPLPLSTRMSGASQASPYVAGVAALCLEAGKGQLNFHDLRRVLIGEAIRERGLSDSDKNRLGAGLVSPMRAVLLSRTFAQNHISSKQKELL